MLVTINIPANDLVSPSSWGSEQSIKGMLERIWRNFRPYIQFASRETNIPPDVIGSFIAVESAGNPTAGTSGHITQGLMQWNRNFAKKQLEDELRLGRMTPNERAKLAEFGIHFNSNGETRNITNSDQLKPELNILIGSIILGQLIDTSWATVNGKVKLDRVIAVYNAGAFGDTGRKARSGRYKTPAELASVINPISRSYIAKMLGYNGAMHIANKYNIFS